MLIKMADILGQERAHALLASCRQSGKMGHAYLFHGPMGVGKKMMAHALATLVNCQQAVDQEACGLCPSCKKMASNNHPDYLIIEPEGVGIKIKQIRELQKTLAFPPFEDGVRVVILPDIHRTMARPEVANALLKTLEEPPANTLLLITVGGAGTILPTISSRCQQIPFAPLPVALVSKILVEDGLVVEQAQTLAALSDGSPGLARRLHKKDLLTLRRKVVLDLVTLVSEQPEAVAKVYELAAEIAGLQQDINDFFDLLITWFRDLIFIHHGQDSRLISVDIMDHLQDGVKRWSSAELMAKITAVELAEKQIGRHCNRTLVCEVLLFAIIS